MSYYILPKNINHIDFNPKCSNETCKPYVSESLLNYYCNIKDQIITIFSDDNDLSNITFEYATKFINPHEFIFSKVPGSKFSVSKLKPNSNIFYDLLETSSNLNIFESYKTNQLMKFLHISPNYHDSIDCFEIFREDFNDEHVHYNNKFSETIDDSVDKKYDFIFYEIDNSDYINSLVEAVISIISSQKSNGTCIIKICDMFYKPVIDILYFLSSIYEKVYISKPSTNNVTTFEKYVICKNFLYNEALTNYLEINAKKLVKILKTLNRRFINSLYDFDIPYYFKNKVDELNIIIGQQQLQALDQIIVIYKNKNKEDKIENIKKSNIQKSVLWCEKYKIPCNKFTEKINIFLPIINEAI